MSQDYHYQIVVGYDGKYPKDQHGYLLDPDDMRPVEGRFTHWFPKTINGRRMIVQRKNQKRWESSRKVAACHVCNKSVLGKKRKFYWAKELTNPYGALHFAIGDGDDFFCFDYNVLDDGRVIVDCTINSETGSFIMSGGYEVVPLAEAPKVAMNFIDEAVSWCVENDVKISKKGWNQDYYYFYRRVFWQCDQNPNKPDFSERQFRFGGKKIDKYCGLNRENV